MYLKTLYSVILSLLILYAASCDTRDQAPVIHRQTSSSVLDSLYKKGEKFSNANPDTLFQIATQLIKVGTDLHDNKAIVKGERYSAKSYWNLANHSAAMKMAVTALRHAERWKIREEIPAIYAIIGNLHKEKANYGMALAAVKQGMEESKTLKDTVNIIYMSRLEAMFTQGMGSDKKDTAIIHRSLNMHLQGLKMAESSEQYEKARIPYYNNIAQVYVKRKQLDSAEYFVSKAIGLAKKYDQQTSLTYSYTWLAQVFERRGDLKTGLNYLTQALEIAKELKQPFRQMEIYRYMTESLRSGGKYKEALEAYSRYGAIRDSIQVLQNVKQLSELEVKYEAEKKDGQIITLGEMNRLQTKQTAGALGGLVIFLILSVAMFFQYRIIRTNNQVLAENNKKINEQSEKMQFLMKELHHRVKNNLQIVSNLLSLQASRLADEDSKRIMKAGQQRIETMSIIHRSLYSHDNVNLVNMKEYITDLMESISQSFGVEDEHAILNMTVDASEMDVDIAMPLGLIINEWITNSFKHAFRDVEKPAITLSLIEVSGNISLEIKDNGPGFDLIKWQQPNGSFGVRLIKVLSKQLAGNCRVLNESGACLQLEIPFNNMRRAG